MSEKPVNLAIKSKGDLSRLQELIGDSEGLLSPDREVLSLKIGPATMLLEHLGSYLSKAMPKIKDLCVKLDLPDNLTPETLAEMTPAQQKVALETIKIMELSRLYDSLNEAVKPVHDKIIENLSKLADFQMENMKNG